MADLLLEIGTEEIPAGFMPPALAALEELAEKMLAETGVGHGKIYATGTPRRLVLTVRELADVQELVTREVTGPAAKAAYDAEGQPTKACLGFARGQGVAVEALQVRSTPKGDYVVALREEGGRPTREILAERLPALIGAIPFAKSMRWGDGTVRFARPVRWILAILGGEVVPFEFAGLSSGNISRGHRSMSRGSFTVTDTDGYFRRAKSAMVIVDHQQRRGMIADALAREAEAAGGVAMEDPALLDLVNFLVEFPVVTCGTFDQAFLRLPPEVLVTSMRAHQKYFPVTDDAGRLKPLFLTVNNVRAEDMGPIRAGNERVLSARLADARFFWSEDTREPLAAKVEKLKKVLYQEQLGTSHDKMTRFTAVALHLAGRYGLGEQAAVERTALLCKADLVTEMVGEFPELQGTMGKYYALESGESPEVAAAIEEHYLPRFAGDRLPENPVGMAVGLADRLDTIAGSFGIGQKPTGSEDPYGLRRHTLAVINIILERDLRVDLDDLLLAAASRVEEKAGRPAAEIAAEMAEFFRGRLYHLFTQEGYRPDLVEAVLSPGIADLADVRLRLRALADFCGREDFEPLAVAFKRVVNILPPGFRGDLHVRALAEEAEKALYQLLREKEKGLAALREERRYPEVLLELAGMRPAVDAFFDGVMVMVEDEALRLNRLALMSRLAGLFAGVADFSKIST